MKPYQVIIGSPIDYEELVAYINIQDKPVALLSQDKGKDALEVVFFDETANQRVPYDVLVSALNEAKVELLR